MPISITRLLLRSASTARSTAPTSAATPFRLRGADLGPGRAAAHALLPIKTWRDKAEFDATARKLVQMFQDNFAKFEPYVDAT